MRKLFVVVLTVFGLMFASCSLAETKIHDVQGGEILGRIAKKYGGSVADFVKVNSLKDKNKIWKGQKLIIPETNERVRESSVAIAGTTILRAKHKVKMTVAKVVKSAVPSNSYRDKVKSHPLRSYSQPDADPVTRDGNFSKIIENFFAPVLVKKQFQRNILGDQLDFAGIGYITSAGNPKAGDSKIFSELWGMGHGKKGDVKYNYSVPSDTFRKVKYWYRDYDGWRYYLMLDGICFNPSYFAEPIPVPRPLPPQKIVVVVVEETPPEPESIPEPFNPPSNYRLTSEVESFVFGGENRGISNHNSNDRGRYYGWNLVWFLARYATDSGDLFVGPAGEWVRWNGTSENVDYEGGCDFYGGEIQHRTSNDKIQFRLLFGDKEGEVYGNGFDYWAREVSRMMFLEGTYQWWNTEKFYQCEVGTRAEIALSNDKHSTLNGLVLTNDPATNQSSFGIRGKGTYTKYPSAMPTAELNAGYSLSNHAITVQERVGVKLHKEIFEPSLHLEEQFLDSDINYSVGANMVINLSRLCSEVYDFVVTQQ